MKNYNFQEKEDLLKEIFEIKALNIGEKWLITKYCLIAYFKSLRAFGIKSEITKDTLKVLKEVRKEVKQEDDILTYLARNIDDIDHDALVAFLDKLDILNEVMFKYYINVIVDIEESCNDKDKLWAKRSPKEFTSLCDSTKYLKEAIALTESEKQIRSVMGYSDEFWNYIDGIVKHGDLSDELSEEVPYARPIYDGDDAIAGIDILVPRIVNQHTANIALQMYKKAHDIYASFGKHDITESEKGMMLVKMFDTKYLSDKVTKEFGR